MIVRAKSVGFLIEKNVGNTNLEVGLFVVPGTLFIDSDTAGLEINIDNKKDDYIGGPAKSFTAFGSTIVGSREYQLSAGNYTLTIKKNNDTGQNLLFRLTNGKETRIGAQYDIQKNSIMLIQK